MCASACAKGSHIIIVCYYCTTRIYIVIQPFGSGSISKCLIYGYSNCDILSSSGGIYRCASIRTLIAQGIPLSLNINPIVIYKLSIFNLKIWSHNSFYFRIEIPSDSELILGAFVSTSGLHS